MAVEDGLVSDPGGLPLISEGRAGRLIAVGDIHGCATALRTLVKVIDPRPEDTVVVLGDVFDWGPNSRDCVQQLIDLSNRCRFVLVRGNHEEMLFAALESQSELRYWLNFGGEETLKSYPYRGGDEFIDPEHVRFLKEARDFYETDEFIFVHASYDPNKPMSRVRLTNPILQGLVAFPGGKVRLPGDANEDSHRETKRSGQGTILAAYDRRPCPLRPIRPSLLSTRGTRDLELPLVASGVGPP